MFFATEKFREVDEILETYITLTTNLNDYITGYNEFRNDFGDYLAEQFEHDLYIKSFNEEVKFNERDILQKTIISWRTIVSRGGPIPNNV